MTDTAIIVGAGVVGVTTAYALARRGIAVTLVDRRDGAGEGTSYANGAQLSFSYTDALGSPALLKRLPFILAGGDPGLTVSRRLDPDFLAWSLAFLRNCSADRSIRNTLAGLQLAQRSRLALAELLVRHPIDFGHTAPGKLLLYDDPAALRSAAALAECKMAAGADLQLVTGARIAAIEPALEMILPRLAGAIWSAGDEVGDPHLFCTRMLPLLARHYDVAVRLAARVERIETKGEPAVLLGNGERIAARHVVLCAGPEAPALLPALRRRLPIMPVRGHSFTAPLGSQAPRVSITDTARKLVFCALSGRMRVAGQADVGVSSAAVSPDRLRSLVSAARSSLPHAACYERLDSSWAGLRPLTPNSLPIIERHGPLTLNLGHGALGWTYACGAAEEAARLVVGEAPNGE